MLDRFKYPLKDLSLKTLEHGKWDDDVWSKGVLILEHPTRGDIVVGKHISVKSQFTSQSDSVGGLSWMWQLKVSGGWKPRHEDPMLSKPSLNAAVCGVQVDDYNNHKCYIYPFYWPDIFPFLTEPARSHLLGKKRVIYWRDVQDFVCRIREYEPAQTICY